MGLAPLLKEEFTEFVAGEDQKRTFERQKDQYLSFDDDEAKRIK